MGKYEDCLQILGCDGRSTEDDIRRAYKSRALQVHPDKNPGDPDAKKKFQELSEAYTFLLNEGENDSGYGYHYYEDIVLFELLRFFMNARRERMFDEIYGGSGDCHCHHCSYDDSDNDDDDDDDYAYWASSAGRTGGGAHNFACEQGDGPPTLRGKKAKRASNANKTQWVREPSKKKQHKIWKQEDREYSSRYRENSAKYRGHPPGGGSSSSHSEPKRDFHQEETKMDKERTISDSISDRRGSASSVKPKKPEPNIPQAKPKKKSKKELLAEQKQREKEMEDIGNQIKDMNLKEKQKSAGKKENEATKEEPKITPKKGIDPEIVQQLMERDGKRFERDALTAEKGSGTGCEDLKKSKSKRRREAKQKRRRRGGQEDKAEEVKETRKTKTLSFFAGASTAPSADSQNQELDWGVDGWNTAPAANEPSQEKVAEKKEPVIRLDHYSQKAVKVTTRKDGTKVLTKATDGAGFGQQRKAAFQNTYTNRAYQTTRGSNRNTEWNTDSFAPPRTRYKQQQQQQRQYMPNYADLSYIPPAPAMSDVAASAPLPDNNVWHERRDFYHSAAPSNESEEDEMLQAAIKLSLLQAEEDNLKRKILQEENATERPRREAAREVEGAAREAERAAREVEGAAREAEGAAREVEGAAREAEGAAREVEGAAREAREKARMEGWDAFEKLKSSCFIHEGSAKAKELLNNAFGQTAFSRASQNAAFSRATENLPLSSDTNNLDEELEDLNFDESTDADQRFDDGKVAAALSWAANGENWNLAEARGGAGAALGEMWDTDEESNGNGVTGNDNGQSSGSDVSDSEEESEATKPQSEAAAFTLPPPVQEPKRTTSDVNNNAKKSSAKGIIYGLPNYNCLDASAQVRQQLNVKESSLDDVDTMPPKVTPRLPRSISRFGIPKLGGESSKISPVGTVKPTMHEAAPAEIHTNVESNNLLKDSSVRPPVGFGASGRTRSRGSSVSDSASRESPSQEESAKSDVPPVPLLPNMAAFMPFGYGPFSGYANPFAMQMPPYFPMGVVPDMSGSGNLQAMDSNNQNNSNSASTPSAVPQMPFPTGFAMMPNFMPVMGVGGFGTGMMLNPQREAGPQERSRHGQAVDFDSSAKSPTSELSKFW